VPGATLVAGLGVVAGLAGVVSAVAGAYQTWLEPSPWVLLGVGALLLMLTGMVLGRSANWRGGDPRVVSSMAVVAVCVLVGTAFLALWKTDQHTFALLDQKFADMAGLTNSIKQQVAKGQEPNPEQVRQIAALSKEIDELPRKLTFATKDDVKQAISQAISRHENAPPRADPPPASP